MNVPQIATQVAERMARAHGRALTPTKLRSIVRQTSQFVREGAEVYGAAHDATVLELRIFGLEREAPGGDVTLLRR